MASQKLQNTELRRAFQAMPSENLASWEALSDFIFHKVGLQLNSRWLDFEHDQDCWGGLQCKQYPNELGKLLAWTYQRKNEINSYCEIGLGKSGTFCVVDSFLRAVNPYMGKSTGIDSSANCSKYAISYLENNPQVEILHTLSADFEPEQNYDLCLIDGDHSYQGVEKDFIKMKDRCKYIAFHDIHLEGYGAGVKQFWEEIKSKHSQTWEFPNEDKNFRSPVGMGVVSL